jgi:tRNA dimethylallyltransferase
MVRRVDPPSAARIQPRDYMRLERALEVYYLTGRPLTEHFDRTTSPLPGVQVVGLVLDAPRDIRARIERRVADHFARGFVDEVRRLLADGVPETARPFGSLGYRQIVEHLRGARDEAATRALIVTETRRYARRQLIWFRKEPNLEVISGPGELAATVDTAARIIERRLRAAVGCTRDEEIR